jgi:hypothetical protein
MAVAFQRGVHLRHLLRRQNRGDGIGMGSAVLRGVRALPCVDRAGGACGRSRPATSARSSRRRTPRAWGYPVGRVAHRCARPTNPARLSGWNNVVLFQEWLQLRQDSRAYEFKPATQRALTLVQVSAHKYNTTIQEARVATRDILARHADAAASALAQDKNYIQWQQEDLERRQSGNSYVPPEQRKWYGSVEHAISTAAATGSGTGVETAGQLLAQWWLESSASPEGPNRAHLWLLAEQPKRAAAYVQSGYRSDMHALPPPLDWVGTDYRCDLLGSARECGLRGRTGGAKGVAKPQAHRRAPT